MTIPFKIFSLPQGGFQTVASLLIDGLEVNMILDTGASLTTLDYKSTNLLFPNHKIIDSPSIIKGIGNQESGCYYCTFKTVSFGSFILENYEVPIIHLSHIRDALSSCGLPAISGIIGNDILVGAKVQINYNKRFIHTFINIKKG